MPTIDDRRKTASFHLIDFMYSWFNRPLDQTIILEVARTDEALEVLMDAAGILPTQFDFDIGYNIIDFVYFEKGTKFGDAVRELMEAEMGRFYMAENGVIRFKNRQNYSSAPVWHFDKSNVLDIKTKTQDDIINVVEILANVRQVQAKQKYWELQQAAPIAAGQSIDIWADFDDPVTSVDDPEQVSIATTSSFTASTAESLDEGSIVTSNIAVDTTLFSKSCLMTFTNTNPYSVYINVLELWATPAKVVKQIYLREQDDASVAEYDERVLTIENDFINNEGDAYSKAHIILDDWAQYGGISELTVKGNPALQIGDAVSSSIVGYAGTYIITKIVNKFNFTGTGIQFTQVLTLKKREFKTYFTIGVSTIGGTDVIAP